jgi:hypothetical protein
MLDTVNLTGTVTYRKQWSCQEPCCHISLSTSMSLRYFFYGTELVTLHYISKLPFSELNVRYRYTWDDLLYVQVTVHCDSLRINNQQDASISKILFCHEALHVSGIFCVHHQELSDVHVAIGVFHAGYVAAA